VLNEKGFKRKTYDDLKQDMEQKAKEEFGSNVNLSSRSPLGILIKIFAWFLSGVWKLAEKVYNSAFPNTATGNSLSRLGPYIGISRLNGDFSRTQIEITGTPNEVILSGFQGGTVNDVLFETIEDAELDSNGEAVVEARALEMGQKGNVDVGTITEIINPHANVDSITNTTAGEGGRDQETDEEFRDRFYKSTSKGGASTPESIRGTLLETTGVRDAIVEQNILNETDADGTPPKSIAPFVFGGADNDVAQAVFDTKSGGIRSYGTTEVTVTDSQGINHTIGFTRPTITDVYVNVTVTTNSQFPSDGHDQVRTKIIEYIGGTDSDGSNYNGLALNENVVHAKLVSVAFSVNGVEDVDIEVSEDGSVYSQDNITISQKEVAETDYNKVVVT